MKPRIPRCRRVVVLAALATFLWAAQGNAQTEILINGRRLTFEQMSQIQLSYGFLLPPGRYWYDPRSGLWGVEGWETAGFFRPNHNLGPLATTASRGDSGIFLNGRQLNGREAFYFEQILGPGRDYRGRWWLDGWTGGLGLEGDARPLINMFQMFQARATPPQNGRGKAHSWSSTFGYGGSDGECSYVNIPGSGSVMTGNCGTR